MPSFLDLPLREAFRRIGVRAQTSPLLADQIIATLPLDSLAHVPLPAAPRFIAGLESSGGGFSTLELVPRAPGGAIVERILFESPALALNVKTGLRGGELLAETDQLANVYQLGEDTPRSGARARKLVAAYSDGVPIPTAALNVVLLDWKVRPGQFIVAQADSSGSLDRIAIIWREVLSRETPVTA